MRRFLAFIALHLLTLLPGPATADAPEPVWTYISWQSCSAELVDETWIRHWGNRLECGRMHVPMADDQGQSQGLVSVAIIRIKAGLSHDRKGSLFFNFGGPGRDPRRILPDLAYLWSLDDGTKDGWPRVLTQQFDLVAVVPRGLGPSTCDSVADAQAPLADTGDVAWSLFVQQAKAVANACNRNALDEYMGTLQHVQDMERFRLALGEPAMNFIGYSHGAWPGVFYAATYPGHAGRIVLDSPFNYTRTVQEEWDEQARAFQETFNQRVLAPAVTDAGYGVDLAAALQRIRGLQARTRAAWMPVIGSPAALAAMLVLTDWTGGGDNPDWLRLASRVLKERFSTDKKIDGAMRSAAAQLVSVASNTFSAQASISRKTYYGMICGDTPWRKDWDSLRATAMSQATLYPVADTGHLFTGAVCRHWHSPARPQPALAELIKAPPLLIVQAEFDPVTPLTSTNDAFAASPGAYLVVAKGMFGHGVFGMSHTYCVEHGVGVYLLRGEKPASRFSHCEFTERTQRKEHSASGIDEATIRFRLREILRHS